LFKFFKIFFLFILLLFFFNQLIIEEIIKYGLSQWFNKEIEIKTFKMDYKNQQMLLENLNVKNSEGVFFKNIFQAKKVLVKIDVKTLFDETVVFKKLEIISPAFYYELNGDEQENYSDNVGIAQKQLQNKPDKIWPDKKRDKNFVINKVHILYGEAYLITPFFNDKRKISLSNMYLKRVGNKKGIQHYKDVFKYIVADITARVPEEEFKKFIKKIKLIK